MLHSLAKLGLAALLGGLLLVPALVWGQGGRTRVVIDGRDVVESGDNKIGFARGHKRAGRQPPIPAATLAVPAQQAIQSPRRFLAAIPQWIWAIGTIIALIAFIRMYA